MIDLHCHLLPGIDDGPSSVEEAVDLALASYETGVRVAVATPHFNHRYPTEVNAAQTALATLRDALKTSGCELDVQLGCEIASNELESLGDADIRARTLGGGDCLLIEPPFHEAPDNLEMMVNDAMVSGFTVMIAHPERSLAMLNNIPMLKRMVSRGALCSITAASLRGRYGKDVKQATLELCSMGLVHNVASDAHDLRTRTPGLEVPTPWPEGLPSREELEQTSASLLNLA
ncbi:MAG: CpsB/CapC family capsule biosynthesis tyrosine phosphatase [Actinomycetes bacterium]